MRRVHAIVLLLVVTTPAIGWAQRLPRTVVPERYRLTFAPDFERDRFTGRAEIDVTLLEPADRVTLHALEMEIHEAAIVAGERIQAARVSFDPGRETVTLTVPERLAEGPATLRVAYTGILNDKLRGFYLSRANGRKYAVTQMEATDARRAFPSFDEPAFKATFDITLVVDEGDTAISNGALLSETPGPTAGKRTLRFATTPKMSTYLVAMLVGDFQCNRTEVAGTRLGICATPDKLHLTAFALEAASQQLPFFNDYFGIPYPFGKLDIIAVPDFAAGAMENVGAITFREQYLLADPATATEQSKRTIANILAHEIAHQWFGNLVTMQWWDDLWLNEGFATWAANKPVAAWRPGWRIDLEEALETQTALGVDALQSTRALRTTVETPEEINQVFDAIAYEKGAAVLRMIEAFVGADAFRRGVAAYLEKHSYANATSEDLWTEIARASGKPVNEIMRTFIDQPGVPLVRLESSCENGRTRVALAQERFFLGPVATGQADAGRWQVPVCLQAPDGSGPVCHVLAAPSGSVMLDGCAAPVFGNAGAMGYYRTAYSPESLEALADTLTETLQPAERISLLEDEWAMVRSGRHPVGAYLTLAEAASRDRTAQIIELVGQRLETIGGQLVDAGTRPAFQAWVREHFGALARELGWRTLTDSPNDRAVRAALLPLLGEIAQDQEVLHEARALARQYLENPASVDPTLSATVLQLAASAGDVTLYEAYLQELEQADSPQEYYRYLSALAAFDDPALTRRTLELSLTEEVRSQDAPQLIAGLLANPETQDDAWAFVKARWARLEERLGTFQGIPSVVGATRTFCEPSDRDDVRAFFEEHEVPAASRVLQQALETIETCIDLRERQQGNLAAWLEAQGWTAPTRSAPHH